MYQTILFDLDGTLTDPKEGITKSVQYSLKYFGIDVPDLDDLLCFIGPPLKSSFMTYYGFDDQKADAAVAKYRERFSAVGLFENGVIDGVMEMLAKLKQAHKILAVATSKPGVYTERILDKYKMTSFFDAIVGSGLDDTRGTKAEVIEEVLRQLHIKEEDRSKVVMIGDRKHDIIGGKVCQLDTIGVTFGYAEPGELEAAGADYIMNSVQELTDFLLS